MKEFKITKLVRAKSIDEAIKIESKGEIVDVYLSEGNDKPSTMGF